MQRFSKNPRFWGDIKVWDGRSLISFLCPKGHQLAANLKQYFATGRQQYIVTDGLHSLLQSRHLRLLHRKSYHTQRQNRRWIRG
ncbi:MAG: hypothetical protein ACFBSF_04450 [Leptolyngbyaceae cyanobacterium]